MRKILVVILLILGLILVLAGLGLIQLTQNFLLYLGIGILLLAAFFFLKP